MAETRTAIIRRLWSILQTVWVSFILVIAVSATSQIIANPTGQASQAEILKDISWVFGPNLAQLLTLYSIILFIAITLLVRLLAKNPPPQEVHVSVKELEYTSKSLKNLEHVSRSLDAVSTHLQTLAVDFVKRVLEDADEQIIEALAEKTLEPFKQELKQEKSARLRLEELLKQEKEARLRLEKEVQTLLQRTQTSSFSAPLPPQSQAKVTQKLIHYEEHEDLSSELIQ